MASKKAAKKLKGASPKSGKSDREETPGAAPHEVDAAADAGWIPALEGYSLKLEGGKIRCRNRTGKELASAPAKVMQAEAAQDLLALRDWLEQHAKRCTSLVEGWMLRSLPVPRAVLQEVFADLSWKRALENAVVFPLDDSGEPQSELAGFLKAVDATRGIGIIDLDGETRWLEADRLAIPHPILLPALNDFRELAQQLTLEQGLPQLFRETFQRGPVHENSATRIGDFSGGKFVQLMHAVGRCRTLGYRVRGGFACCPVFEDARRVEARFWIGSESPEAETETGDLSFVDEREQSLRLGEVGAVAFSEGMRMATAIYGGRVVEQEQL